MDPVAIGLMMLVLLTGAVLAGIYIGLAFAVLGFVGVWLVQGDFTQAAALLAITPYSVLAEYTLMVVPLLILMGLLASEAGISQDAYEVANVWLKNRRGGLATATIVANAGFAATSGSSAASAAVFSKIAMPQMMRLGYNQKLAVASVTSGSILAMLIPPSIMMIIYSYVTGVSIGKMFIAGVIPGLLIAVVFSIGIRGLVWWNPKLAADTEPPAPWREKLVSLHKAWGVTVLIVVVLGGIWGGIFTPTEAGAVGAAAALAIGLVRLRLSRAGLWRVLMETGRTTAVLFFMFVGAQIFSRMLAITGVAEWFTELVFGLEVSPMLLIVGFVGAFLIAGCFMDSASMILLLVPLMFPVVINLGFDPIWFGVIVMVVTEIGGLTPPFGLNVFVVKAALGDQISVEDIFIGVFPFIIFALIALAIIMAFPQISLWLPQRFG
jgi:tripartite ATP-independent transporter DctM subunit